MALGFMRRHRRWLYVFLWVVIAAFIILYIPAFQGADAGSPGVLGTASTTVLAGPATALSFTVQPTTRTAGSPFSPAVAVSVHDAFGNAVSGATVSLALDQNPGGATLLGGTSAIAVNGVATFGSAYLTKAAAGYTLAASSGGLSATTSQAFDVAPASPSVLAFVQEPSTAIAGAAIAPAPAVELRDAYGNVTGASGLVTVVLAATLAAVMQTYRVVAAETPSPSIEMVLLPRTGLGSDP